MKGELDSVTVYEDAATVATSQMREFFSERAEAELGDIQAAAVIF